MENCEIKNNTTKDNKLSEICKNIELNQLTGNKENKCIINISQIINIQNQNDDILKSICEIKLETNNNIIKGLGFLLNFWINQEIFYCIISNENIIKKEIINNNNIISLYFNNELISSNLKSDGKKRYIKSLIDYGLDVSVIEILKEDNITKDYFLFNVNETENNRLINENIYTKYIKGNKLLNVEGKIIKINKNEFIYLSNVSDLAYKLSGCPIFLENNNNILGIHRGIKENKTENYGYLIFPIINLIKDDINRKRNTGKFLNGKYIWEDNKYYIGEYNNNNIPNGKGVKYYSNGNIQFEGYFMNGKFEGKGKYYYDDGDYFIGEYKNGLRNGKGITYNKNGNLLTEGVYFSGKREGTGKNVYEDGVYYVGEFKNGLKNGKGIEYYPNENILYEGDFLNGNYDGNGKYFYENGEYYIGQFKNGLSHGKGIEYYSNGNIKYDGDCINDKPDGNGKYVYQNGEYYIGQFKNGLK